ncbi:PREDICTED: uncharacterized protein LOC109235930 [Nicotiana attenuata]|uniref:uncharacterized protein LOC109235930 n=1 Tax=Nicotiana attenuata TaxID=49451 RepID=UPI0009054D81|nr:PREDICTED: uncharacterized protein LOC109235930 [Nicotiana attenuata]
MTRRKRCNELALEADTMVSSENRMVTPESGVPQTLEPPQLVHWMQGMGCAPTILQAPTKEEPVKVKEAQKPVEADANLAAQKLTFSVNSHEAKITLVDVVRGNRSIHQGSKLEYYPPIMKEGIKVVRLNQIEVEEETRKWKSSLIGYVLGGLPTFKDMLKFVYGVWQFVDTPQVLEYGPYTFNNRHMILKQWETDFDISKETNRIVPTWVILPGLPIQYWATENLGRIASYLGKPVCTDKLTAQGDRISYARVLVHIDISQHLPEHILIEDEKGGFKEQKLEYEWKPSYCQDCLQIGHIAGNCKKEQENEFKHEKGEEQNRRRRRQTQKKQQTTQWKVKDNKTQPPEQEQ